MVLNRKKEQQSVDYCWSCRDLFEQSSENDSVRSTCDVSCTRCTAEIQHGDSTEAYLQRTYTCEISDSIVPKKILKVLNEERKIVPNWMQIILDVL